MAGAGGGVAAMTIRGSCLCGAVSFEVDPPFPWMGHCHCSMCRKAHGAAFATHVEVDATRFRGLDNAKAILRYESSQGVFRTFCGRCGAITPDGPASGPVFVPAGLLDDDPQIRPQTHIFVASKAPWHDIADALPRFDAYPPGAGEAVAFSRRSEPAAGTVRGSCLCGGVAYEIAGPVEGPFARCGVTEPPAPADHLERLAGELVVLERLGRRQRTIGQRQG